MHTVLTNMACIFYYIGNCSYVVVVRQECALHILYFSYYAMGVKGVTIRRKMHEKGDNTGYCQGNGIES